MVGQRGQRWILRPKTKSEFESAVALCGLSFLLLLGSSYASPPAGVWDYQCFILASVGRCPKVIMLRSAGLVAMVIGTEAGWNCTLRAVTSGRWAVGSNWGSWCCWSPLVQWCLLCPRLQTLVTVCMGLYENNKSGEMGSEGGIFFFWTNNRVIRFFGGS